MYAYYKPGVTLDTPIDITMAAADWLVFINWCVTQDTEGIDHLIFKRIAPQVMDACYDQASVKAARAHHAERQNQMPQSLKDILRSMGADIPDDPTPEDFQEGNGNG
jgi:hypothetical protein